MSALEDATVDLWGKDCDDLQSTISITDGVISGTLKYVADYTSAGFDMSQGTTVKCKFNSKTTPLDEDGIIVLQMTEAKKDLSVVFEATDTKGDKNSVTFALSGLTLAAE